MKMKAARKWPYVVLFMLWATQAQSAELHIAAANLSVVMPQLTEAFELAQQIENGAPFDVFLAADTEHVDELAKNWFVFSNMIVAWAPALAPCGEVRAREGVVGRSTAALSEAS